MRFTLSKHERLKSRKLIERLFVEGKSVHEFPLQIKYLSVDEVGPKNIQAGFSVPKRNFKRAVHRNRIKRQMRECYRLEKPSLLFDVENSYVLMILYLGKTEPKYQELSTAMNALLSKWIQSIKRQNINEGI